MILCVYVHIVVIDAVIVVAAVVAAVVVIERIIGRGCSLSQRRRGSGGSGRRDHV